LRTLNSAAGAAPLRVVFDTVGRPALKAVEGGLDHALARLFAIIECASYEGTWWRMKICDADDCEWAFYDHTKNRSGAWCSMESCGNRAKGRAYRERRRERA
jgi:predicted RNA-binding Zn ribbon-like protein